MTPLPPALFSPGTDVEEWVGELATSESIDLPERAQAWRIDGTGSAEWALAHVAQAEAELEDLTAQAVEWYGKIDEWYGKIDEWYGKIDEWLSSQSAPHRRTKAFFEAQLQRYALDLREADPKRKSVVLPSGKVQTTAKAAKVVVTDEDAVIAWARTHAPDAVKERLVMSEVRSHMASLIAWARRWAPAAVEDAIGITELRSVVHPRKVTTLAWVTNSCGCKVSVRDDEGLTIPDVGTLVESCSECGAEALIGKVEELAYRWLATTEDGAHVPGVDVEPDEVTAKVVLG